MIASPAQSPLTLGLFEKRIEGGDQLMELARLRFLEAGMGIEVYSASPEMLEWGLRFRPEPECPVVAHLSRGTNLAEPEGRNQIARFARRFAGRIHGMVVHDHSLMAEALPAYIHAAHDMNTRLRHIEHAPWLFVEYAVGVDLDTFVNFFEAIRELEHVSVCVDIGHVGIFATREAYARIHPGVDVCGLKFQPDALARALPDAEAAMASARPAVLDLLERLGPLGKPAHFHLHDGHPFSTLSPFGVSDHLSFFQELPLNFDTHVRRQLALMYGPDQLFQIVAAALRHFAGRTVSFTLEIHPVAGRLPLGDDAELFNDWRDLANPERMNYWLSVLAANHQLLCDAIEAALHPTLSETSLPSEKPKEPSHANPADKR